MKVELMCVCLFTEIPPKI